VAGGSKAWAISVGTIFYIDSVSDVNCGAHRPRHVVRRITSTLRDSESFDNEEGKVKTQSEKENRTSGKASAWLKEICAAFALTFLMLAGAA
jgi:hypothetical protein